MSARSTRELAQLVVYATTEVHWLTRGGGVLTQHIGRFVPRYEAGVVPVAHPFLQDPLTEVLSEPITRGDQTVISTVGLRESSKDRPGHQSPIR